MTKQGTLKELNVQPGDVVSFMDESQYKFEVRDVSEYQAKGLSYDQARIYEDQWQLTSTDGWRIISRAAQPTATPDLTDITTPFGLLDEATQEALRAHGGPYEYWDGGNWCYAPNFPHGVAYAWVYRAKKTVVVETEVMTIVNVDGDTVADIHVRIIDGIADWSCAEIKP